MPRPLPLALVALVLAVVALAASPLGAQPASAPLYVEDEREPVRVTTTVLFQRYTDGAGGSLSEWSTPVAASVPVGRGVALGLRASYASAGGDGWTRITAPADVQLALSAIRPLGAARVVGSVAVNVPSGRQTLSVQETQTALRLGQSYYAFRMPAFGQGLGVTPGVTLAVPLGERLAVGAAVAYQHRGAFQPREDTADRYDAADATLLTAGLDASVGRAATLALDVTGSLYSSDTFGGQTYATGNTLALTTQFTTTLGPHAVYLLARGVAREVAALPPAIPAGRNATVPRQGRVLGSVRFRLSDAFALTTSAQARLFAASDAFAGRTLVDLGLAPEVRLGRRVALLARGGLTLGTHAGFEAGAGLAWTL